MVKNAENPKGTTRRDAKNKRPKLFDPDKILTRIHGAVERDVFRTTQLKGSYCTPQSILLQDMPTHLWDRFETSTVNSKKLAEETYLGFLATVQRLEPGFFTIPEEPGLGRSFRDISERDQVLYLARKLCKHVLTPVNEGEWFRACKHGPGTTVGIPFGDTSYYTKFTLPISCTERGKNRFRRYLAWDTLLTEFLQLSSPMQDVFTTVEGSRASTVPKSDTVRRFIAIEPTANMYMQQGLMAVFYSRLKAFGLDVESLPNDHVALAKEASITRNFATIDFSSASDSVSIDLLEYLFPRDWFVMLMEVRSPVVSFSDAAGMDLPLTGIFATMGNSTTFPVETLLFWAIARATDWIRKNPGVNAWPSDILDGSWSSQFGDDCIIPTKSAQMYMNICTSVGFVVNVKKSHFEINDPFRESCGGEFLAGAEVKPYKPRRPRHLAQSALEPWLYMVLDGIQTRAQMALGPAWHEYFPEFWQLISAVFRENKLTFKFVPPYMPEGSGYPHTADFKWLHANTSLHYSKITQRVEDGRITCTVCIFRNRSDTGAYTEELRYHQILKSYGNKERKQPIPKTFTIKEGVWYEFANISSILASIKPPPIDEDLVRDRKLGGYVLSKHYTSCWTLPNLHLGGTPSD